ncbi:GDSL-type esterase/lipase family protein [Enterococcus faecalis]|uniref:GDSL-type esterase/lipase family protein n=1 Tax=Enterococcus faecalis TaxID=1351 RepID=UPI001A99474A|nr:GDSL-type esterase/lipase family protein [Enterococcus faecalis]
MFITPPTRPTRAGVASKAGKLQYRLSTTKRLAQRLQQACPNRFVVLNQGISGNKLLDHGRSHSALSRLDRDVIAVADADQWILFEGINDIRHGGGAQPLPGRNAADMLLGYQQVAARLHAHGIRAWLGTLTPFGGSERYEPVSAATRTAINQWARGGNSGFDGIIDFDDALRDPKGCMEYSSVLSSVHSQRGDLCIPRIFFF